ncbi:MAG TPA: hypothetical protein DIU07_03565 [Rhodobacteraceae bacterium]|nr:hypothetical protein [Paracoccaceae bacterium]
MGASWLVFRVDRLPSRAARCGQGCHTTSRRKCPTGAFRKRHSRPGQWFQSASGLHQNWMRDYDPTTGRYIQADPLGLVDGASVYGYARQNPGRYVDPRGEHTTDGGSLGQVFPGLKPGDTPMSVLAEFLISCFKGPDENRDPGKEKCELVNSYTATDHGRTGQVFTHCTYHCKQSGRMVTEELPGKRICIPVIWIDKR